MKTFSDKQKLREFVTSFREKENDMSETHIFIHMYTEKSIREGINESKIKSFLFHILY